MRGATIYAWRAHSGPLYPQRQWRSTLFNFLYGEAPPVELHRSEAANALGMSPLALAVVRNEVDQVRQLLAEGADPLQPDLKRRTAVDLARQLGRKDLLALMVRGRTQMLHNTYE